jgi:hypothetical protein
MALEPQIDRLEVLRREPRHRDEPIAALGKDRDVATAPLRGNVFPVCKPELAFECESKIEARRSSRRPRTMQPLRGRTVRILRRRDSRSMSDVDVMTTRCDRSKCS